MLHVLFLLQRRAHSSWKQQQQQTRLLPLWPHSLCCLPVIGRCVAIQSAVPYCDGIAKWHDSERGMCTQTEVQEEQKHMVTR